MRTGRCTSPLRPIYTLPSVPGASPLTSTAGRSSSSLDTSDIDGASPTRRFSRPRDWSHTPEVRASGKVRSVAEEP